MKTGVTYNRTLIKNIGEIIRSTPLSCALILMLATTGPILAEDSIYDTSRELEQSGNECIDVPFCISVESPVRVIEVDQVDIFSAHCPDDSPYVWHWDARQHEHIHIQLSGQTKRGITFSASNKADAAGNLQIFIGCSYEPFDRSIRGQQTMSVGQPSKIIRGIQ